MLFLTDRIVDMVLKVIFVIGLLHCNIIWYKFKNILFISDIKCMNKSKQWYPLFQLWRVLFPFCENASPIRPGCPLAESLELVGGDTGFLDRGGN